MALCQAFLTRRYSRRTCLKTAISGVSDRIVYDKYENRKMPQRRLAQKTLEHRLAQNTHQHPSEVDGHGRFPGVTQNTFGARLPGYRFLARRKMSHNYCGSRSRTAKKRHCSKLGPKIEKNSFMVPGTRLPGMVGRAHNPQNPNNGRGF